MGYQRDQKRKVDLVLTASVEGEGPLEALLPVTLVKKDRYEVSPVSETGIATLVTRVLTDNRVLCLTGKLTNANLIVTVQQGEETPVKTTVTNENFKLYLKLKKDDKFHFEVEAGDNFVVELKAVLKEERKCRRKRKRRKKCKCGCDSY